MKKIGSKISLIIICCSCLTVLIITGISIVKGTALVQKDTEERMEWMAEAYATSFSSEFDVIEDRVKYIESHVRETIDTERLKTEPNYLAEYEEELTSFMYNFAMKHTTEVSAWCYFNPELSDAPHDIYFCDDNGDKIPERQKYIPFSYFDNLPTQQDDKQWWYSTIKSEDGYWTNPYKWKLSSGQIIESCSYARPIYIDGELIAVVGTSYRFNTMADRLGKAKVYKHSYAALYNEELGVIFHPKYYEGTRFTSENLMTAEDGKYKEIAEEMLNNNSGVIRKKIDGKNTLVAYSHLSNGWIMTVNPQYNEIFADMNILVAELIAGEIACIVFAFIVALAMGKHFSRPILKVVEGVEKISNGNFNVYIDVNTHDEIKIVANSINNMVANTRSLQQELERLAFYDDLTGGINLNKFKLLALDKLQSNPEQIFFMVRFDINGFKVINDIYGFHEGDNVLRNVYKAVDKIVSADDIFARISSDDFVAMITNKNEEELIATNYLFKEEFDNICYKEGKNYKIDFTTGVYKIPKGETDVITILDRSKMAHKKAKSCSSQNKYMLYNEQMRDEAIRIKTIEDTMYQALNSGEFVAYLQPKFNLKTNTIEGAEALVRWIMPPDYTVKSPIEFIPIFEKNGFVAKIDYFMLEQACKMQRKWLDAGAAPIPISVNQSKIMLFTKGYVELVCSLVQKYDIPPHLIELEVLETLIHENIEQLQAIILHLDFFGFLVSIDDFGCGYSSLNMLKDVKADVLKIDREFLNKIEDNERGEVVLTNIIRLAKELHMSVVCEGVETEKQAEMLRRLNCDTAQGYLYAKPMPLEEFEGKYLPYLMQRASIE
ncbi:MAG: EAL domain-containing protein [Oscillospiraceae bacterium]